MSNAIITKQALGQALKTLMLEKTINKITVRELTESCKLTRHTFYNHFQDVYELLGWIYAHEVIEDFEECCKYERWRQGIDIVLKYTLDNKTICLNTFHSLGREHLEKFLQTTFLCMIRGTIEDIAKGMAVPEIIKEEAADFYTYAIVGEFLRWLEGGLKEKEDEIAQRIIRMMDGTIVCMMQRYADKSEKGSL